MVTDKRNRFDSTLHKMSLSIVLESHGTHANEGDCGDHFASVWVVDEQEGGFGKHFHTWWLHSHGNFLHRLSFLAVAQISARGRLLVRFDGKLFTFFFLGHKVFNKTFSCFLATRCSKSLNFDRHVLFILSITSPGCLAVWRRESPKRISLFLCSFWAFNSPRRWRKKKFAFTMTKEKTKLERISCGLQRNNCHS